MFGARGEIRTHHKADPKGAASSNWATRAIIETGGPGTIRTCDLDLRRVAL